MSHKLKDDKHARCHCLVQIKPDRTFLITVTFINTGWPNGSSKVVNKCAAPSENTRKYVHQFDNTLAAFLELPCKYTQHNQIHKCATMASNTSIRENVKIQKQCKIKNTQTPENTSNNRSASGGPFTNFKNPDIYSNYSIVVVLSY